jgi:hypothetical protein
MTDDKTQPDPSDRPERAKPNQSGQDAQQRHANVPDTPDQGGQPLVPGRKPLFRS